MPPLSLAEWFFLALGIAGFARFGWCLVWLIGTEAPPPAWLERSADALVGFVLAAFAWARQRAVTAAALLALLLPAPEGAVR